MLAENDLIAYDKPSRRFTTTDNGYQFFKRYDELIELIEPIATIAETTRREYIAVREFGKQSD